LNRIGIWFIFIPTNLFQPSTYLANTHTHFQSFEHPQEAVRRTSKQFIKSSEEKKRCKLKLHAWKLETSDSWNGHPVVKHGNRTFPIPSGKLT
jgi:5-keto 4-deoxyuronate isomerase